MVLKSSLDYEHTTSYLLTIRITDTGKPAQPSGNITIKVKKNFFDLSCARYDFRCFQHYVQIKGDSTKVTEKNTVLIDVFLGRKVNNLALTQFDSTFKVGLSSMISYNS